MIYNFLSIYCLFLLDADIDSEDPRNLPRPDINGKLCQLQEFYQENKSYLTWQTNSYK